MPLEDFEVPTDWISDLDERWPERVALKAFVVDKLCDHIAATPNTPRVLELGIGDGELILQLYKQFPTAEFVAVDIKQVLLNFVRGQFNHSARVTCVKQDLSADRWTAVGDGFDVIYSLQSFHDLGGKDALLNSYQQCLDRLAPNGMMLNTDFVEPMPQDDPQRPRRFCADVHIEMLTSLGFREAKMFKHVGQLACLSARVTDVLGARARLVPVLHYSEQLDTATRDENRMLFRGRTAYHLQALATSRGVNCI